MTNIRIAKLRGCEGAYHPKCDTVFLGNWNKPFNCPFANTNSFHSFDDFERVLHIINHELLHGAIHRIAFTKESIGLDRIIAYKKTESWEGVAK